MRANAAHHIENIGRTRGLTVGKMVHGICQRNRLVDREPEGRHQVRHGGAGLIGADVERHPDPRGGIREADEVLPCDPGLACSRGNFRQARYGDGNVT